MSIPPSSRLPPDEPAAAPPSGGPTVEPSRPPSRRGDAISRPGGEPEEALVLCDVSREGPGLAKALREGGFHVDVVAEAELLDRVVHDSPLAIVVDIEAAAAARPLAELQARGLIAAGLPDAGSAGALGGPLPTAVVAIGTVARAVELGLPAEEPFARPVDPGALLQHVRRIAMRRSVRERPESVRPSRRTQTDRPSAGRSTFGAELRAAPPPADLAAFPAIAGLPEVESILPDLEGGAVVAPGRLSPEIEALLERGAQKARQVQPPSMAPANDAAPVELPTDLLAAVDELYAAAEEPPVASLVAVPGDASGQGRGSAGSRPRGSSSQVPRPSSRTDRPTGPPESAPPLVASPESQKPDTQPPGTVPMDGELPFSALRHALDSWPPASVDGPRTAAQMMGGDTGETGSGVASGRPVERPVDPSGALASRIAARAPEANATPSARAPSTRLTGDLALAPLEPAAALRAGPPDVAWRAPSRAALEPARGPATVRPASSLTDVGPSSGAMGPAAFPTSGAARGGTRSSPPLRAPEPPRIEPPVEDFLGPAVAVELASPPTPAPRDEEGVLGAEPRPAEPLELLGRLLAARGSGALVLTAGPPEPARASERRVRRVVLHEGDVATALSEVPQEGLLQFLVERGDLSRDVAAARVGRLPHSGRHAAAALIANGFLSQDDLWPVLRSHAEWVLTRAMLDTPALCQLERVPSERVSAEPAVFGGAAGVEVFLEVVRRAVEADDAILRLGGPNALLDQGTADGLLGEAGLGAEEAEAVRQAPGTRVDELLGRLGRDFAPVLYALRLLSVLDVRSAARRPAVADPVSDKLDDEAIRARVRARLGLVAESDYFALLGVSRQATSYEIKRAFLDLRRFFEPSRLLTAGTAELTADVALIAEVLEEAYEILRDATRRERYRRAIEATPGRG